MKYNVFSYLIGEGFRNVFKNKKSTMASLMIMCATMIIFGVFFIVGENINHFVSEIESEQGIQVFIDTVLHIWYSINVKYFKKGLGR